MCAGHSALSRGRPPCSSRVSRAAGREDHSLPFTRRFGLFRWSVLAGCSPGRRVPSVARWPVAHRCRRVGLGRWRSLFSFEFAAPRQRLRVGRTLTPCRRQLGCPTAGVSTEELMSGGCSVTGCLAAAPRSSFGLAQRIAQLMTQRLDSSAACPTLPSSRACPTSSSNPIEPCCHPIGAAAIPVASHRRRSHRDLRIESDLYIETVEGHPAGAPGRAPRR